MSDVPETVWVNAHTLQCFRGRPPKKANGLWVKYERVRNKKEVEDEGSNVGHRNDGERKVCNDSPDGSGLL